MPTKPNNSWISRRSTCLNLRPELFGSMDDTVAIDAFFILGKNPHAMSLPQAPDVIVTPLV